MNYKHHQDRLLRHIMGMPFIYLMIVPLIILDIFLEFYHRICFPLYGLKLINRSQYIKLDRHKLSYLNIWEKINCDYCSYANGLLFYASVIAAETEKYWCSIKHEGKKDFIPPPHHKRFLPFQDEDAYTVFLDHKKDIS